MSQTKWKPKTEQYIVHMPKSKVSFTLLSLIKSVAGLIHSSCPKESETCTRTKEENTAQKEETQTTMILLYD